MKKFVIGIVIFVVLILILTFIIMNIPSEDEKKVKQMLEDLCQSTKDKNLNKIMSSFHNEFKSYGFHYEDVKSAIANYFESVDFKDVRLEKLNVNVNDKDCETSGVVVIDIIEVKKRSFIFAENISNLYKIGEHKINFDLKLRKVYDDWKIKEAQIDIK